MKRKIIPDVVDGAQSLSFAAEAATARTAARLMTERRIGALMVVDAEGRLQGILSERDLVTRLLAVGGDPDRVTVGELMTASPATIRPDERVGDALRRMREGGFRHLPVIDDGRIVGMVSVRDLFDAVRHELEEGLRSCEALVYGDSYALSTH